MQLFPSYIENSFWLLLQYDMGGIMEHDIYMHAVSHVSCDSRFVVKSIRICRQDMVDCKRNPCMHIWCT